MPKVFLGVGHGGKDPGAVSFLVEKDINLTMAKACRDYLVKNGIEVQMSREKDEDDTLNEQVIKCNLFSPDLAVDVHNNAGGGNGFEVFYSIKGGIGKTLAENIENEVKNIGQNSRGIKTRQGKNGDFYGFIRMTKCPSVIVEGVFVDNKEDAEKANTIEKQNNFGIAYAKGILKTLNIIDNEKTEEKPNILKDNNKIDNILDIQKYLNNKYNTGLELDNIYGSKTKNAIIKALQIELNNQYNKGLVVDGIFGVKTSEAVPNVKIGAIGNITKLIQIALHVKGYKILIDGIFGSETARNINIFQKENKLVQDGIVGKQTFKSLFS